MYKAVAAVIAVMLFIVGYAYTFNYYMKTLDFQQKLLKDEGMRYLGQIGADVCVALLRDNQTLKFKIRSGTLTNGDLAFMATRIREALQPITGLPYRVNIKVVVYNLTLEPSENGFESRLILDEIYLYREKSNIETTISKFVWLEDTLVLIEVGI